MATYFASALILHSDIVRYQQSIVALPSLTPASCDIGNEVLQIQANILSLIDSLLLDGSSVAPFSNKGALSFQSVTDSSDETAFGIPANQKALQISVSLNIIILSLLRIS